nr:SDR family oxidoreductase [Immundisolibacter cernigliae]
MQGPVGRSGGAFFCGENQQRRGCHDGQTGGQGGPDHRYRGRPGPRRSTTVCGRGSTGGRLRPESRAGAGNRGKGASCRRTDGVHAAAEPVRRGQVKAWMEFAVAEFGDFDILYNNASGVRGGTVESLSREDWDWNLANEVTLIFLAVKHALPVFKRRGGGVILNTGSVAGMLSTAMPGNAPGNFVHNVSKAAVIRMTEHLAVELSPLNIRVNTVSPGLIDTPATRPLLGDGFVEAVEKSALIRRVGQPMDIALAALYLCSDEASFVTGINLPVDGGWTAGGGVGQPDPALAEAVAAKMNRFATLPRGG